MGQEMISGAGLLPRRAGEQKKRQPPLHQSHGQREAGRVLPMNLWHVGEHYRMAHLRDTESWCL